MRKTKRGGDVLTRRSQKSRRACNDKGQTESLASVLEKMRKTKRGGDDLTIRSHESRKAHVDKETKELVASFLEDMWGTERGGDDLKRISNRSRRARVGGEWINESLTSGDLHESFSQDVWTGFSDEVKSNLSKSVASLALCNGDTVVFACSGIAIECQEHITRFLTSASLVTAFFNTEKDQDDLKIEVRLEDKIYKGIVDEYDLDHNFAAVIIIASLDVNAALKHGVEILPHGEVLALGRAISGKLKTTNVVLAGDSSGYEDEDLTCKISEVWEGGPLFTSDGNFVGMNLFLVMERAFFVSWGKILEWLEYSSPQKKTCLPQSKSLKGVRYGEIYVGEKSNRHPEVCSNVLSEDLDSMGYPKPPIVLDDDMILVNTFEEVFGDIYPKGVWRKLGKKASSNIARYVVALASFIGYKRSYACTGFFIEWNGSMIILTSASLVRSSSDENRIDENLRIEVLLPSKRRTEGRLQHYSLHYNIALVSVEDCCAVRPAYVQHSRFG